VEGRRRDEEGRERKRMGEQEREWESRRGNGRAGEGRGGREFVLCPRNNGDLSLISTTLSTTFSSPQFNRVSNDRVK